VGPGEWALGLAIFGTAAWLLAWVLPGPALGRLRGVAARAASGRWVPALSFAALAVLLVAVSTLAFEHRPQLVDSVIQLFQARIFAGGGITAPAPAESAFFVTQHMIVEGGRWYSQYPPGHSALLALGVLVGAPWLVPVAVSLVAALLLHGFARSAYDPATARVTLLLLVAAPFFWFMGASFMSHVSALAGVAAFLWLFARWEEGAGTAALAGAGAGLGFAFLCRPVDAVAVGAVFAGVLAADAARTRRWRPIVACAAGFLAVAALYLAYNAATTGHPLRPGYIELWGSAHGLGFHESPWGERHTPFTGLRNELLDLSLLQVFLFEWPVPALLPLGFALAAGWLGDRWDARLVAVLVAVPATYFFYWHRDTFLGPRFVYVTLAAVLPLTARALIEGGRRLRGRSLRVLGFPVVDLATLSLLLVLLSVAYASAVGIPSRFLVYRTSMGSMKLDLPREARRAGVERGIVFVAESWGSRVIAELRGLGAGASAVEKAYRTADLCDLDGVVRRARAGGWTGDAVEAALDSVAVGQEALVQVEVAGDPTARFRPGSRLSAECLDEIRYDERGYGLFTPQLPANDPDLEGPLVIARDLRSWNVDLLRRYPDRRAWIYRGGRLVPLEGGD
jgi:hypothetical protein